MSRIHFKWFDYEADTVDCAFYLLGRGLEKGEVNRNNIYDFVSPEFYGKYYTRIQRMFQYQEEKQKMKGDVNNGKQN